MLFITHFKTEQNIQQNFSVMATVLTRANRRV